MSSSQHPMTEQHPITPPRELLRKWTTFDESHNTVEAFWRHVATKAAQWGADQELDACCEWLAYEGRANGLRAARRPKPPSLKEEALEALDSFEGFTGFLEEVDIIRRALESISEENND